MNQFKKATVVGIVLLAAVFIVSGCKTSSEKAAEKAIEAATNGQADVDLSTNSVRVNTNGYSYAAGDAVTLPSGFPSDVYIMDGTLTSVQTVTASNGYTVSIETTKSVTEAKSLYDSHMASDGWTITSSMVYEGSAIIYAEKGNRVMQVGINKGDEKQVVALSTFVNTSANTNTPQ